MKPEDAGLGFSGLGPESLGFGFMVWVIIAVIVNSDHRNNIKSSNNRNNGWSFGSGT